MPSPKVPQWSELPSELLQEIADKHTNYIDYIRARSVCKSWEAAIPKRPNKLLSKLPILLLPYHQKNTCHRGFYNIPDGKTRLLQLPEAIGKHCCGSSNGWLVMVEETPRIFLLNPLTRKTIDLPCLTTLPTFPTQVIFRNSMSLNESFIRREKLHVRDTFIIKAIVTNDPSLCSDFAVVAIYGSNENLAMCRPGDSSWTVIDQDSRYKDVIFRGGKLLAVTQLGKVFSFDISRVGTGTANIIKCLVDLPPTSSRAGYMQWYLVSVNQDQEDLVLVARYRKVIPEYEYRTESFEVYKLEESRGGGGRGSKWIKMESLGDTVLFLGSSGSHSISARDYGELMTGNCIYFTDDYMRIFKDYVWEGHDFGVFDCSDGSLRGMGFTLFPVDRPCSPNMFFYDHSMYRDTSSFVLPPPIWVTLSP